MFYIFVHIHQKLNYTYNKKFISLLASSSTFCSFIARVCVPCLLSSEDVNLCHRQWVISGVVMEI